MKVVCFKVQQSIPQFSVCEDVSTRTSRAQCNLITPQTHSVFLVCASLRKVSNFQHHLCAIAPGPSCLPHHQGNTELPPTIRIRHCSRSPSQNNQQVCHPGLSASKSLNEKFVPPPDRQQTPRHPKLQKRNSPSIPPNLDTNRNSGLHSAPYDAISHLDNHCAHNAKYAAPHSAPKPAGRKHKRV